MKIITTPNPLLRKKAKKVANFDAETHTIIEKMVAASLDWEKSHEFELSAAMAAPQLGINARIIIIRDNLEDKKDTKFTALINPEVIKTSGPLIEDYEGCLSVPAIYGLVPRPRNARIKAFLADGTEVRIKAEDSLARVLLHEIDHCNGRLFIDHIKDKETAFYKLDGKGELQPLNYEKHIKNNKNLFPDE